MSRTNSKGIITVIRMSYITEKEEAFIDENNIITITRDGIPYTISKEKIYGYGVLDLSEGSSDSKILAIQKWSDLEGFPGRVIPVYDYSTGLMKRKNGVLQRTETWSCLDIVKYGYSTLDKPARIIIFKQVSKGKVRQ